jgi:glucose-6-phosphate isomerase
MKNIQVDLKNALSFINQDDFKSYDKQVKNKVNELENKTGKGSDFLGWLNLPENTSKDQIAEINETAKKLRSISDVIVVIGIGGSYLGAKSIIDALSGQFDHLKHDKNNPLILFAGQNLSEDYHYELLDFLKDKDYSIIVISKSGTTTEPAIAFRLFRKHLKEKFGNKEASRRIVAITDASKGALRKTTDLENYKSFIIDDTIGGRYSVLTPVGLLPVACAGFNIEEILEGAKTMLNLSRKNSFNENPAFQYAAIRHALYSRNKTIEILANYNPKLDSIAEWWKQLFGESEGKENKGIFPSSASFTTDLHSIGQYVQEGLRNVFETIISVEKTKYNINIPSDNDNYDSLNFLAGKPIDFVNKMAEQGTILAHINGNVPNIKITIPEINEYYLGQLLYFFEKSCAISGYLLGVNPFDQPGVEAYKKNMFALLEKPGFEKESNALKKKLNS